MCFRCLFSARYHKTNRPVKAQAEKSQQSLLIVDAKSIVICRTIKSVRTSARECVCESWFRPIVDYASLSGVCRFLHSNALMCSQRVKMVLCPLPKKIFNSRYEQSANIHEWQFGGGLSRFLRLSKRKFASIAVTLNLMTNRQQVDTWENVGYHSTLHPPHPPIVLHYMNAGGRISTKSTPRYPTSQGSLAAWCYRDWKQKIAHC